MRRPIRFLTGIASSILLVTAIACSTDAIDNFTIRISPEVMNYTASINVADATTNQQIDGEVSLGISGPNADDLYTVFGTKDFEVFDGNINVGLHPRANPTPGNPTIVNIDVLSNGYLTASFTQTFYAEQEQYSKTVEMINIVTPPPGVGFGGGSGNVSGDSTTEDVVIIVSDSTGGGDADLQLEVESGTSFFDGSGAPISGANLNVQVAFFSGSTSASLAAFPGGLSQNNVTLPDGSTGQAVFQPLAFSDVNMDIDGTEIKTFSDSIDITFAVDPTLINPDTDAPYAIGDQVELWTNDVGTTWTFESYGTITQGDNGLEVIYRTNHLSGKSCQKSTPICSTNPQLRFNFTNWPSNATKTMKLNIFRNGQPFGSTQIMNFTQNSTSTILQELPNQNAIITAQLTDQEDGSTYTADIPFSCGMTVLNADFGTVPAPPSVVSFDLTAKCPSNPQQAIRPNGFIIRSRRADGSSEGYPDYNDLATIMNGQAAAALYQNTTYDFRVHLGEGVNFDTTVTVNKLNYTYVASRQVICSYQP